MIDPVSLGATLYLPASRADLPGAVLAGRHPDLRSVVICLEDSILPRDVPQALVNVAIFLDALGVTPADMVRPLIFIRPRSPQMLAHLLTLGAIEHIDGFVIPKATADCLPEYLAVLSHDHHMLMPTLETREVFDAGEMRRLRDQLLAIQDRVLAVRIGGNDLLQLLGARRSAARTCYDGPLGPAIASLVLAFSPWGFQLSAPVFEHFGNAELLLAEVERDLEHGLLTKTAIHPSQIPIIQGAYAVDPHDLGEARSILEQDGKAIFASRQAMCEPATHAGWARLIEKRSRHFGARPVALSCLSTGS